MWIRIDCIRIRSQVNNITELISNHMLRCEKQFFSNLYLNLTRLAIFLGSDLHLIPLDHHGCGSDRILIHITAIFKDK